MRDSETDLLAEPDLGVSSWRTPWEGLNFGEEKELKKRGGNELNFQFHCMIIKISERTELPCKGVIA